MGRRRVIEEYDTFDLVICAGERHGPAAFTSMIDGYC
jgi:hypothetical protein